MRKFLRIASLAMVVLSLLAWISLGTNLGWTKTSVTRWEKDPVTDLDGPIIEKRFVPGVDLLGAVCAGAGVIFGVSFFTRKTQTNNP
jgi:hypothetical protein